jgi:hypothetical protein
MKDLSRRDFLKYLGIGAVGLVARPRLAKALDKGLLGSLDSSDVVQCYHEQATSGSAINEPIVQMMMDESIKALAGIGDVGEAWKSIFPGITESSIIGIKVNCINSALASHPPVARCIASGLARMDFSGSLYKLNNIIVWDRTNSELTSSGYTLYTGSDPDTMRIFGTNQSGVGYDSGVTLNANGSNQNPSKILSQMSDYLIDLAVLKTHSQGVITLNMKNHYGSVHNPGGLQHTSGCSPAIPSLNQQIRDVITPNNIQKLFVIDGLFGLYSGGPGGSPNFNPKLIIMSKDTVACDYQGQNVINTERVNHGLGALNAAQITTAAQPPYSLGTTDVNLIELNNVGVYEERPAPGAPRSTLDVSPHPLRDRATISFSLPRSSAVEIELVSTTGNAAARVYSGRLGAGRHSIAWRNDRGLAAGNYFLRLSSRQGTSVRKVTVVN